MLGSNWSADDYSAWRREQVAEAANLARYSNYSDLAEWGRIQEIYAEAGGLSGSARILKVALHEHNRVIHSTLTAFKRLTTALASVL